MVTKWAPGCSPHGRRRFHAGHAVGGIREWPRTQAARVREQPAAAVTAILEYEGGGAAAPIVMRSSGRGAHRAPANPGPEFRPRAAACARQSHAAAAVVRTRAMRRAALRATTPGKLTALPGTS